MIAWEYVLLLLHTSDILINNFRRKLYMSKSISISIRVSEEDLMKLKQAARLEAYASYSEFIRRTVLIEANAILKKDKMEAASEKPV